MIGVQHNIRLPTPLSSLTRSPTLELINRHSFKFHTRKSTGHR